MAARRAQHLGGTVGQHLVRVHVVRSPGACLVHIDDELIAQLPAEDLIRRPDDGSRNHRIKATQCRICLGGGLLDQDRGGDEIGRRPQSADGKIGDGSSGLDAVVRIGGNGEIAQRIALDA